MCNSAAARLLAALFVPLLVAACDGAKSSGQLTGPSPFSTSGFGDPAPFVGASVEPLAVPVVATFPFFCPQFGPYTASFALLIDQRGGPDLFLSSVSVDFTDRSGLVAPQIFGQTDLSAMFGTTIIPAGTRREFPFTQRFGCGFVEAPAGVGVRVSLHDRRGRHHRRELRMTFANMSQGRSSSR